MGKLGRGRENLEREGEENRECGKRERGREGGGYRKWGRGRGKVIGKVGREEGDEETGEGEGEGAVVRGEPERGKGKSGNKETKSE